MAGETKDWDWVLQSLEDEGEKEEPEKESEKEQQECGRKAKRIMVSWELREHFQGEECDQHSQIYLFEVGFLGGKKYG